MNIQEKAKLNIFKKHGFHYAILFVLVFINIFFFSSVSPIHNILNLQYDQLVYHLIGKGMKYGKIPYIDLIDHKGIYLFSTYALSELICEYRHIGLFIVTLIINYVYTIFAYKIAYLLSHRKTTSMMVAFMIEVLQNTYFLSVNGLDCETIILPFIMIAFYLMMKYLLSNKNIYPIKYIYIDGILFGIILFIKANACLFFLSIVVVVLVEHIKKKEWKHLLLIFVFGMLGVIIALLPGIIYCFMTGSLASMIEHSFIVNMKYLGTGYPGTKTIVEAFIKTYDKFKAFVIVAILSVPALYYILREPLISEHFKNLFLKMRTFRGSIKGKPRITELFKAPLRQIFSFYIISLLITIYAVFVACRPYTHYMILLLPYYIPIFLFFIINLTKIFDNQKVLKIFLVLCIVILNLLSYSLNLEIGLMNGAIQQNLCSRVLKLYNREKITFDKKKPNVFVVGYGMYIYEALNLLPNEKYFATPVVLRKDYSRPYDEILKHINSGRDEFVILLYGRTMNVDEGFREDVERVLINQYVPIGKFSEIDQQLVMYKRNGK